MVIEECLGTGKPSTARAKLVMSQGCCKPGRREIGMKFGAPRLASTQPPQPRVIAAGADGAAIQLMYIRTVGCKSSVHPLTPAPRPRAPGHVHQAMCTSTFFNLDGLRGRNKFDQDDAMPGAMHDSKEKAFKNVRWSNIYMTVLPMVARTTSCDEASPVHSSYRGLACIHPRPRFLHQMTSNMHACCGATMSFF